jgi:hypothetical protein
VTVCFAWKRAFLRVFWKHAVPVIDPNTLPKDVDTLRKIVVDLCEQLSHESSEKDKYRSLLRELLDAVRSKNSSMLMLSTLVSRR